MGLREVGLPAQPRPAASSGKPGKPQGPKISRVGAGRGVAGRAGRPGDPLYNGGVQQWRARISSLSAHALRDPLSRPTQRVSSPSPSPFGRLRLLLLLLSAAGLVGVGDLGSTPRRDDTSASLRPAPPRPAPSGIHDMSPSLARLHYSRQLGADCAASETNFRESRRSAPRCASPTTPPSEITLSE